MKVVIGADSAGFAMKAKIIEHLKGRGFEVTDVGAYNAESSHYPEFAYKVAKSVSEKDADFGILVCGTGIGMSIAANKHNGIRAACCSDTFSARMTRMHNDANVLCLGGRVVGAGLALDMVKLFIETEFEGGRHTDRVAMLTAIENEQ